MPDNATPATYHMLVSDELIREYDTPYWAHVRAELKRITAESLATVLPDHGRPHAETT